MDDPIPRGVTLPEIFQKVLAKVYLDAGLGNLPKANRYQSNSTRLIF